MHAQAQAQVLEGQGELGQRKQIEDLSNPLSALIAL
jgi:hypothetical protein